MIKRLRPWHVALLICLAYVLLTLACYDFDPRHFALIGTRYDPGLPDGRPGAAEIAAAVSGNTVIVTKSTVPVGTGRKVAEILHKTRPDVTFDVVSNPEFLREGSAIEDFMRPDSVVIGAETDRAREVMKQIYRPLFLIETPIVFTGLQTAEIIKYAGNTFLATKITFINEIANLCDAAGADVHAIAKAMALAGRIGKSFLHPGPGYSGSCLSKDTLGLVAIGKEHGVPMSVVAAVGHRPLASKASTS